MRSVRVLDETTICLTLRTSDVPRLRELLGARYRTEVLRTEGVVPFLRRIAGRKGLFAGAVCFAVILFLQQSFIAELRIQGDGGIPESEIAEVLADHGLYPGCRKSQVDEESIKMALYQKFPELDLDRTGYKRRSGRCRDGFRREDSGRKRYFRQSS